MDTPNMSPESNAPINSRSRVGSGNFKFIAMMVALVLVAGIVVFAWVLTDDDDNNESPYVTPIVQPVEDYVLALPEDVRFHLEFEDQHFYTVDFALLENCSIRVDEWWRWEDDEEGYGYRKYIQSMFLIGPVSVYDMYATVFVSEDITNPGTPVETNE